MSVSNVEVGKKVKEMRLHNNMSQQEFSERTHITQSALSRYENGVTPIPYEVIENISKEFKLPVSYLLGIKQESMEEDELLLVAFYRNYDDLVEHQILELNLLKGYLMPNKVLILDRPLVAAHIYNKLYEAEERGIRLNTDFSCSIQNLDILNILILSKKQQN